MTLVLGLDLGGTNIKATVLDVTAGTVHAEQVCPTASERGPHAVLDTVAWLAAQLLDEADPGARIGLAVPGHFDPSSGTARKMPNLAGDWTRQPLVAPLTAVLGRPVRIINDARALGLAELRLGACRGVQHALLVAMGTGVGGAVVIDGRLYLGTGHAGEIGHTTAVVDGPACGCGNRGCLDRVASAAEIARLAEQPTVQQAAEAARAGDPRALRAFAFAGTYVGRALADAVVLLWPQRIVIGGGVAAAGEILLGPIRSELRRRARVADVDAIDVVPAQLGTGAGAIGAALWAAEACDLPVVPAAAHPVLHATQGEPYA